jgi:hypothetical protein
MLLVTPLAATAQTMLDCPGAASVAHCDTFHFHVQMYRPDTRAFVDLWGINQYASQASCERAREAQVRRNLAVAGYFRTTRGDQNYEPDRFGACHCDMTLDRTNPRYLSDLQRTTQLRLAEDVRQRVRERLLDAGLTSDSEVVRSAGVPPGESIVGLPKFVKVPASSGVARATNPDDMRSTRSVDNSKPSAAALDDLPLVDIPGLGGAAPPPSLGVATAAPAPGAQPVPPTPTPMPTPAPAPVVASSVVEVAAPPSPQNPPGTQIPQSTVPPAPLPAPPPAPAPAPAPMPVVNVTPDPPAEDAAENFINTETQRIQNVLKASGAIGDEEIKSKIYEACMQRIQLLSNLRTLIQTAGAKSRLADFARNARSETERLTFVGKLFGDDMRAHWAPGDARDVIVPAAPLDNEPETALRDASGKFNDQQRKHALYVLLARSQPTEEQQLWLSTVADSFLQ